MEFYARLAAELAALKARGAYRTLPDVPQGLHNLSSNDYLGLLHDEALREAFHAQLSGEDRLLSAASSRLLTGDTAAARALEADLAAAYGAEAALVLDSGYHANTGILPALAGPRTLVLADKLSHASMIDGIRASGCKFFRYRHNDLSHARQLLERHATGFDEVFLMTESVFSMDGDRTDLRALVALKRDFPNLLLYLDEAHGVGVFGETGLGCAHEDGVAAEIDLLVGTPSARSAPTSSAATASARRSSTGCAPSSSPPPCPPSTSPGRASCFAPSPRWPAAARASAPWAAAWPRPSAPPGATA